MSDKTAVAKLKRKKKRQVKQSRKNENASVFTLRKASLGLASYSFGSVLFFSVVFFAKRKAMVE